jgi:hypothetical protein
MAWRKAMASRTNAIPGIQAVAALRNRDGMGRLEHKV